MMDARKNPTIMRKLALISYLNHVGHEQSKLPEPMGQLSILAFHDSVELFLHLSAEAVNTKVDRKTSFMDYFGLINDKIAPNQLTQHESMNRLNNARVAFKHYGTLPSMMEIDGFRVMVGSFFQENTKMLFGIEFDHITLVDLVNYEDVRIELSIAEEEMAKQSFKLSQEHSRLAFEKLMDVFEKKVTDKWGTSPFEFAGPFDFFRSDYRKLGLEKLVENIGKSFEKIQEAFKVNALGVDYKKYIKFNMLTPVFWGTMDGKDHVMWEQETILTSQETSRFCINFVIEATLMLQEVDMRTELM